MFDNLSERLERSFKLLKGEGKITEINVAETLKDVRRALLDADVNYKVAKAFTDKVKEKALGQNVLTSVKPSQLLVKIVHDELATLMGGTASDLNLDGRPSIILMSGLQGSGKTTFTGKLANMLKTKRGKKPLLVACDVYRPAAIEQLRVVGEQIGVPVYMEEGNKNPVEIALNAITEARAKNYDVVIVDTAGRLAIDEISIHKGHKYATVVMDLDERAIIHVVEGKRQVDLQAFFDRLQELGIDKQIESVSVDMNAAYPKLIKENLPHAKIAYDRFHVMQQLNKQVLAAAKVFSIKKALMTYRNLPAKQRKLPQHKRARAVAVECVKNAEWLVITDPDLLSPARQERLRLLRENNQLFADLYAVTAKLKTVWRACSEQSALSVLNECIELCEAIADEHGFDDVRKFGRMLRRRAQGIAAACVVKFATNILEGANNTTKVIKRVAYGFRDFEYFALKLLGAFLGIHYKQ